MDSRDEAILKTLLYSDFFDYPLTEEEVYNFLIGEKISKAQFHKILNRKNLYFEKSANYFFLKGRGEIVDKRSNKKKFSLEKLEIGQNIIQKLSIIPTIKLIGISGTLAMKNCLQEDDIDIFIIAEKNFAWTTRFMSALLLIILGVYRNKKSTINKNKICLNLVLDEKKMHFESQDLFTAHEIVQLMPVFERDNAYLKFIQANKWIDTIFPNFRLYQKVLFKKQLTIFDQLFIFICRIIFLEKLLKVLQLFYMQKSITKERLEKDYIGLHPFDYKQYILQKYYTKIGKFGLE
jgi:hypothetical protein